MAEFAVGSQLAGCLIEGVAGRGGMGVVYRATQIGLGRTVALKVIAPEYAADAAFVERFERESKLAASIEHPHVIPVYEAGERDGVLYLLTRFVEGTDLETLLTRGGPLEPDRAARIVAQLAAALGASHRRGLVHRDVKPANVLLADEDGGDHAYLTDFGVAKATDSTSGMTRSGAIVGTPDYMAPERLVEDAGDGRSDIYSLGCVLYRLLTGELPYPRENPMARALAHINAPVPSIRELDPALPEPLDEIVRRAMAKRPDDRYATGGDLRIALLACTREGEAVGDQHAVPPSSPSIEPLTGRAATPDPATAERWTEDGPPTRPNTGALRRGSRLIPALLLGLGTIALAAIVGLVLTGVIKPGIGFDPPDLRSPDADPQPASGEQAPTSPAEPIAVGADPVAVALGSGAWVASAGGDGTVSRIEPTSPELVDTFDIGGAPSGIAVGDEYVWVTARANDAVYLIGRQTKEVAPEGIAVGDGPSAIAIGAGSVWIANGGDGTVTRLAEEGREPLGKPIALDGAPAAIAYGEDAVWVALPAENAVVRIDSESGSVQDTIAVGAQPAALTARFGSVWVANSGDGTISRIDPDRGAVAGPPIKVGEDPRGIGAGEDYLWVTSAAEGTVTYIDTSDPGRPVVKSPQRVGSEPTAVAVGEQNGWVTNTGSNSVSPIPAP